MKFVCIALLGLVLAAGVSAQSREEQCQAGTLPEGYYAHETYCNVFFSCSLTYWREYQCYGDGVWNPAAQSCDYATNVNCGGLVRISEVMIVLKIPILTHVILSPCRRSALPPRSTTRLSSRTTDRPFKRNKRLLFANTFRGFQCHLVAGLLLDQ